MTKFCILHVRHVVFPVLESQNVNIGSALQQSGGAGELVAVFVEKLFALRRGINACVHLQHAHGIALFVLDDLPVFIQLVDIRIVGRRSVRQRRHHAVPLVDGQKCVHGQMRKHGGDAVPLYFADRKGFSAAVEQSDFFRFVAVFVRFRGNDVIFALRAVKQRHHKFVLCQYVKLKRACAQKHRPDFHRFQKGVRKISAERRKRRVQKRIVNSVFLYVRAEFFHIFRKRTHRFLYLRGNLRKLGKSAFSRRNVVDNVTDTAD